MKKQLKIAYLIISFLLVADLVLILGFNISFVGYWTDRVIFWIWFLLTILVLIVFWKKRITKVYLISLIVGLILSLLPMGLPFFAIVFSSCGIDRGQVYHINNNVRLQEIVKSPIAKPIIQIIEGYAIFEKNIVETDFELEMDSQYLNAFDAEIINLIANSKDSLSIEFKFMNGSIINSYNKK